MIRNNDGGQIVISRTRKRRAKTDQPAVAKKKLARKPSRTPRATARRRAPRTDDDRVTTFPDVKGKVVREVRFTHDDPNNVLAIAFNDRTVLVFDIDPEPLVLPVDIRAHYIGERRSAAKTWEGLAAEKKGN
jgi:hypothetical protein